MKNLSLNIPETLHYQIKLQALQSGKTIRDFVIEMISNGMSKQSAGINTNQSVNCSQK